MMKIHATIAITDDDGRHASNASAFVWEGKLRYSDVGFVLSDLAMWTCMTQLSGGTVNENLLGVVRAMVWCMRKAGVPLTEYDGPRDGHHPSEVPDYSSGTDHAGTSR